MNLFLWVCLILSVVIGVAAFTARSVTVYITGLIIAALIAWGGILTAFQYAAS